MIRCPYVVPDQHIHENMRERIVRNGSFTWNMPVHECLAQSTTHKYQYPETKKACITHEARSDRSVSCERNIRIIESIPENQRASGTYYYLFTEKLGLGLKTEALEIAQRLLKMKDFAEVEKYEVLLNLASLYESPDEISKFLHAAHQISPYRREALYELCNLEITFGNRDRAMAYFRQLQSLPKPTRISGTYGGNFTHGRASISKPRSCDFLAVRHEPTRWNTITFVPLVEKSVFSTPLEAGQSRHPARDLLGLRLQGIRMQSSIFSRSMPTMEIQRLQRFRNVVVMAKEDV